MNHEEWKRYVNAVKYMNTELYDLDKHFSFHFPTRLRQLTPYANRLRSIIEDALVISGIPRVQYELQQGDKKKKDDSETDEEN